MPEVEQRLRRFIVENFLFGEDDLRFSNDASLLGEGIIDSTGILELITFIEAEFEIQLKDTELVPANLDSVHNLVRFIDRKIKTSA